MKTLSIYLILATFLIVGSIYPSIGQTPEQIYQKGLMKEEGEGELQDAIDLYNQVAENLNSSEKLQAKALLRIGMCYEKLGKEEAIKAYQKLVNNFPGQKSEVAIARERLSKLILIAEKLSQKNETNFIPPQLTNKKIWDDPDTDLEGAISPDGKYLSYVDWETGDLALYEIATGKKRRLTNKGSWDESDEFALMSRWSSDGKQIVYDWKIEKNFCELHIIGLDGSKPRILYSNKEVEWIYTYDWSPDGKQILAYFDRKNGTDWVGQIVLVSTTDGSVRVLKTTPITNTGATGPDNMCFSPDGHNIIYDFPQKAGSSERDIFMLSSNGSREIPLVEHPSHDEFLGWTPDGKKILFASDRNGTFSLWTKQIIEGKPQGNAKLVKSDMGPIVPLGFTRSGSFYYGYSQKNNNIYNAEIDSETGEILTLPKKTITRFEGYNQAPSYSPDGKYLAYISRRFPLTIFSDYTMAKMGGNVLCIKSLETGKEREIFPDINRFRSPRWSSDGRSVFVIDMNNSGSKQIDIQTGNVSLVLHDDNLGPQPTERSLDGKTIFYVRRDRKANTSQILVRNLESGTKKEIYRSDGGLHIRLSPDGKWLAIQDSYMKSYFRVPNIIPSLSIIPSAGGEPRELCRFEDGIDIEAGAPFTWTPDGKYILYSMKSQKKEIEKWDLYRIPAKGGKPEKLGLEMGGFLMNLSIHPNGQHIAFSITEESNAEIWVMENFLPLDKLAQNKKTEAAKEPEGIVIKQLPGKSGTPSIDGNYFSFMDGETGNLAIRDLNTDKTQLVTTEGTWDDPFQFVNRSKISPDNKRVAYSWSVHQSRIGNYDLRVLEINNPSPRILYKMEEGEVHPAFWLSDNNTLIAFTINTQNKTYQIISVNTNDGSFNILNTYEKLSGMPGLCLSSDEKYIAFDFLNWGNKNFDIYSIPVEGGQEVPLVEHPANDRTIGWLPGRKELLFLSDCSGTWDIWALTVLKGKPNGQPELIFSDVGEIKPVEITRDGTFYFSKFARKLTTTIAPFDAKEGKIKEKSGKPLLGSIYNADWSPDGKSMVYTKEILATTGNDENIYIYWILILVKNTKLLKI